MWELFIATTTLVAIAIFFGGLLGFASIKFKVDGDPIVEQINKILPQTQCGQCGYPGCKPYAEAITKGVPINRCPPGGEAGVKALAELLDLEVIALDDEFGETQLPRVAFIIEEECIGCTKCIQACPVDAIVGAAKQMHTVITSECTGCDLCVAPCPVDCIEMPFVEQTADNWLWPNPQSIIKEDASKLHQKIPLKVLL